MFFRVISQVLSVAGSVSRRLGGGVSTALHRASLGAVGRGTRFQAGVHFRPPSAASFGDDCYVWRGVGASRELQGGYLHVGDRVQINADVHLDMTGGLIIGNDVLISEGAAIYTHDHGLDPRSVPLATPQTIGDGAWIGMRAVLLPSCRTIGTGAVIGAGAIVTRDVAAGAIVAGNPAREIGRVALAGVAA